MEAKNQFNRKIKILKIDNRTKFKNTNFSTYIAKNRIIYQYSILYTLDLNTLVEELI